MRPLRPDVEATRERLARLAWLLDNSIPLPGTQFRIGLEALLGLVPVVGDAAGVILSSYILQQAAGLGVPKSILLRMGVNIAIEGVVGIVPFAGDVFDAAWKANLRNVRLLNDYLERPAKAAASNRLFVALLTAVLVLFLIATGTLAVIGLRWIGQQLGG
jgi:hypothetical protein